jgi:hypothetical protein
VKNGLSLASLAFAFLATLVVPNIASANTIYACVSNRSGEVRIVTAATTCHSRETKISWNSEGPQGPQGVPGPKGDPGPAGASTFAAELVVHTGTADGVTTFNSVVDAYAAASSTGWTLIRILPGTYSDSTDLPLDKFVVFQGSGESATILTGKANGSNIATRTRMSVFKNLTIADIFTFGAVELDHAIVSGSVYATFGGLVVDDSTIFGNAQAQSKIMIKGSTINGLVGIYDAFAGSTLTDTIVNGTGSGVVEAIKVLNGSQPGTIPPNPVILENVTASGPTNGVTLSQATNIRIRNSKITGVTSGVGITGFQTTGVAVVDVRNSEVSGGTSVIDNVSQNANTITLVNSQLVGGLPVGNPGTTKIFNCYDGSIAAIPNQ